MKGMAILQSPEDKAQRTPTAAIQQGMEVNNKQEPAPPEETTNSLFQGSGRKLIGSPALAK